MYVLWLRCEKKIQAQKNKLKGNDVDMEEMKKAIADLEKEKNKIREEKQEFEKKQKVMIN